MANKRQFEYGSAGGPPKEPEAEIQYQGKKPHAFGDTPVGNTFVQRYGRNAVRRVNRIRNQRG